MFKAILLLSIFFVSSCAAEPQPKQKSQEDIVQGCYNKGYEGKKLDSCISWVTGLHNALREEQDKSMDRQYQAQQVEIARSNELRRQEGLAYQRRQQEQTREMNNYLMRQRCASDPNLGSSYEDCLRKYIK